MDKYPLFSIRAFCAFCVKSFPVFIVPGFSPFTIQHSPVTSHQSLLTSLFRLPSSVFCIIPAPLLKLNHRGTEICMLSGFTVLRFHGLTVIPLSCNAVIPLYPDFSLPFSLIRLPSSVFRLSHLDIGYSPALRDPAGRDGLLDILPRLLILSSVFCLLYYSDS